MLILNFTQIKLTEGTAAADSVGTAKVVAPPAFWDGDYDYFWNFEIARYGCSQDFLDRLMLTNIPTHLEGGKYMCVAKSRRKGFSYKNASLITNRYMFEPNSYSIIGAFDKKYLYPKGTMGMFNDYLNFYDEHTPWGKKRDYVNKIDHKVASYKEMVNGIPIEKGFKSQVQALTFKDNPDAARGKDGTLILLEEAGKFGNLIDSFKAIDPALRDGRFVTGMIVIFGTGSGAEDKEADWEDFAEIYYNPEEYNMLTYDNVFDEEFEGTSCAYFFADKQNLVGFMDEQGNSDKKAAELFRINEGKELVKNSNKGPAALNGHMQEFPNSPSEAFLVSNNNEFLVKEHKNMRNKLINHPDYKATRTPVRLYRDDEGVVQYETDYELEPILHWKPKVKNLDGCIVMYEPPVPGAPPGTYVAGFDPVREDISQKSPSLNVTYIHKGGNDFTWSSNTIVASYIGRLATLGDYLRIQSLMLELYNAKMMHENEVIEVRNWYRRHKKLEWLLVQPQKVIDTVVINSGVDRKYGMHMSENIKTAGLGYLKADMIAEIDTDGKGGKVLALQRIYDPGFHEEMMKYDRKKDKDRKANYDRIMAYMQISFARQNEELGYIYSTQAKESKAQKLLKLMKRQYI